MIKLDSSWFFLGIGRGKTYEPKQLNVIDLYLINRERSSRCLAILIEKKTGSY